MTQSAPQHDLSSSEQEGLLPESEADFVSRVRDEKIAVFGWLGALVSLVVAPFVAIGYDGEQRFQLAVWLVLGGALLVLFRMLTIAQNHSKFSTRLLLWGGSGVIMAEALAGYCHYGQADGGRPLLVVLVAAGAYMMSLRAYFVFYLLGIGFWYFVSEYRGYDRSLEDWILLMFAGPLVGAVVCLSQYSALRREHRLRLELLQRNETLQATLARLTAEQTLRQEGERRLELQHEQLLHVGRLNAMGEMVAGIAHEVNQPLQAIAMHAGIVRAYCGQHDESPAGASESIQQIERLTVQCGEIIRRLQRFTRKGESRRVSIALDELINEALALTRSDAQRLGVRLTLEVPQPAPMLEVDALRLQQVLVNVLRNAFEAVSETPREMRSVVIRGSVSGGHLLIEVVDSGCGVSPKDCDRVFETFFTTRPLGMGMGLAISRTIVEDHGGSIRLDSNPDRGVTVSISLPWSPPT